MTHKPNEYFRDGEEVIHIQQHRDMIDEEPYTVMIVENRGSRETIIPIKPGTEDDPLIVHGIICAACDRLIALYEPDYLCDSCRETK